VSSPDLSYSSILTFRFGRVKSLSNVLRDVDDVLPQRDLTDQQKTELGEIVEGCRSVLKELEDTLDKYQELDSNIKGLGGRSRRVWKRLKWDQKDIDSFRNRITSNIALLNAFLGRITR
jgi:peptidoglycan hydrolase CwlO-like protein